MARTPKPLTLLVHPTLLTHPSIQAMVDKGNTVQSMDNTAAGSTFDLILGPNCWRVPPGLEPMIDLAIKAARRAKYGKKENEV